MEARVKLTSPEQVWNSKNFQQVKEIAMNGEGFPKLRPPAVDSSDLRPPTVINKDDVKEQILFPQGGGRTKYLLTEENAGCKFINMGLFFADPGQGSQWHTHPAEVEEEEYLYVLSGKGTMYYKQGGKESAIEIKQDDGIFTGHLTHYIKNTGNELLLIYFSITPLPVRTIIYGVKNDKGLEHVDSIELKPPQLVRRSDIKTTSFSRGGIINWRMINPNTVSCKHGRFGMALEEPGKGSSWHTHPLKTGEEDLFYIHKGKGVMVYLQGGKVHSFEFREGDAIHSHHLTNYTKNTGSADLWIPFSGAPHPSGTIVHEW